MPAPVDDFDALAALLPEALLLVAADGNILASNAAAATLLRRPASECVGRRLDEFVLDGPRAVAELLRLGSRSRDLLPGSLSLRGPDGRPLACRCESALFRPHSAQAPAAVLLRLSAKEAAVARFVLLNQRIDELSREVSRRRAAEAALSARNEWLRVTLASIGDGVIATDDAGRVTFMNAVAQQLTGWGDGEALGAALDEVFVIISELTRQPVESPVAKVLREGRTVGLANHTLLVRRDGSESPIDDSAAPIHDDEGRTVGVVLVFHDTSERNELERELRRKTQRLEEADRRKDEFLSMLAHELRNPLAPLHTGVHLLLRIHGALPEVSRLARMMQRQVEHMTRLVEDLLDVARLTQGRIELRTAPVALATVLEQALEMSRSLVEARGHRLSVALPPADLCVDADATRLVQVFGNLLTNAAKFTPEGGHIDVGTQLRGGEVVVTVRDDGMGIEPALLGQVFDLFVQGDRGLDRSQGGLGIGLTLVRTIVQMHGGAVEACSDGPGRGSAFAVRLPLLPAQRGGHAPAASGAAPAPAARGLSALVVDDNADAAEGLAAVLGEWGHAVHVAHDAGAALEAVTQARPDVVLLDIGIPGSNGYELARRLRALPGRPLLLVAVTGYGQPEARQLARMAGFDAHLTKPVDLPRLQELLAAHADAAPQAPGDAG